MSGSTLVRRWGIFVAPCYADVITNEEGGQDRVITNPIERWRANPANAGKVARGPQWTPATVNIPMDQDGNLLEGGEPEFGAMLTVVHAQAPTMAAAEAILQEIDDLPDVRRFKNDHQQNAWQQIQNFLRSKGFDNIHLLDGETVDVKDLAERVVAIIEPSFKGFDDSVFSTQ